MKCRLCLRCSFSYFLPPLRHCFLHIGLLYSHMAVCTAVHRLRGCRFCLRAFCSFGIVPKSRSTARHAQTLQALFQAPFPLLPPVFLSYRQARLRAPAPLVQSQTVLKQLHLPCCISCPVLKNAAENQASPHAQARKTPDPAR